MKTAIIIAAVAVASYIIFIVGPAVTSFCNVYNRKRGTFLWDRKGIEDSFYAPYLETLKAGTTLLSGRLTRNVSVNSNDGLILRGRYYEANSDHLAILLHGYNALPENNYAELANDLLNNGVSVLLPYSRAHDPSDGKHCTFGLLEQYDLLCWIDYAEKKLSAKRIVLYGMSMGCVTLAFASDKITSSSVSAAVFDCGFISPLRQYYDDCRLRHLPARSLSFLVRLLGKAVLKLDLDTSVIDSLKNAKIPALFVHGTADRTVSEECTRECFEACSSDKKLIISDGSPHTFSYSDLKKNGDSRILDYIMKAFSERGGNSQDV